MNTDTISLGTAVTPTSRKPLHLRMPFKSVEGMISFAILAGGLLLWQLAVDLFDIPAIIVPSPLNVAQWLWRGFTEPLDSSASYWVHLGVTLAESLAGFIGGVIVGVVSGFALAHWPRAERVFYPYIQAFNALPKIAIAPLMVVWLGFGWEPKIWMAGILVFFPMMVNSMAGYHSVEPDRIDLARACSASRAQIFWKIVVPSSLPFVFAGLHMATVLAVLGAIVGEFVGATSGLGMLLLQYNNNMQVGGVFAILVILGAIGFALNLLMQRLEKKYCFWARRQKNFGS
ncbi:MAG: ABC transporter permease [Pseudomonadota bacterium]